MSNSEELISRLGFEAWADNVIVNFIEDYKQIMALGDGKVTMENDARIVRAEWANKKATIVVRAHTKDGWHTHERSIGL